MSESIMVPKTSIFPCPSCGQMIYSDVTTCRFCSATIDSQKAAASAALQEYVNSACNDASMIRNLAGAMWVFFFIRFIPFVGFIGLIGLIICFLVIPVRLVLWWGRYGALKTTDVDYKQAKRNWLIALGVWLLMIIVPVALIVLLSGALVLTGR